MLGPRMLQYVTFCARLAGALQSGTIEIDQVLIVIQSCTKWVLVY